MKKIKLSENLELSQVVMGCMRIADSNLTEAFIQMGVDGLSVVPACVLPVRKAIRSSYADEANRPAEEVKEK